MAKHVVAVPVADIKTALDTPGAFELRENPAGNFGMAFVCPCGCSEAYIPLRIAGSESKGNRECWDWDGNREKPTLSPSLQQTGACRWHGYLRAGVFEEC